MPGPPWHDLAELRDRAPVFRDRAHAGETLAAMLAPAFRAAEAVVFAIPAGGVPVAVEIARRLALPLDVAVVSKCLLPWTTESGFGAVAFDGGVWVNDEDVRRFGLSQQDVERAVDDARDKVRRRVARMRGDRRPADLAGRVAIVVDDGVAAGSTLRAAIASLRGLGASRVVAAVPTAHDRSAALVAGLADELYCANVRCGAQFAVADAYEAWGDVAEDEALALLGGAPTGRQT